MKPPCECGKPSCPLCRAASRPEYQRLYGLLPPAPPCPHEGPVVSWAPCNCEEKHLRVCLHADGPDLCVRGPSADPAVRSCADCPLRPVV